jgi:protein maelstrom
MEDVQVEAGGVGGVVPTRVGCRGCCRGCLSPLLSVLVSALAACLLLGIAWLCRGWLRAALLWVQSQPAWLVCALFLALFTLVSFPVAIGYLVLLVSAGYLLGVWALPLVIVSANVGVFVAHQVIRRLGSAAAPLRRLLRSDSARALLRVISGPHSFRIVVFARLSPIPFGVQNTIFAVSLLCHL